jgi:arabinan endo-1,5-alpha-L-arabinosidase
MILAAFSTSPRIRRSIAALLLSTLALPAAPDPPAPTFANVTVHDPSVIRDGSTYYVFGSHLASASTTDLINWTQITRDWDAVTNPTCVLIQDNSPLTQFAEALAYTQPPAFWAPDVTKLGDGRYYFYYCVCNGTSKAALGQAVASSVIGPYSNVGIMIKSGTSPSQEGTGYNNAIHPNAVDPSVFYDQTGRLWMVYGSYSGGIFILQLDATIGSPNFGQPLLRQSYGKKLIGGNNCTIEGSYIFYSPETAYYYMFFTFGGLDSTGGYNIRMGRSLNPDGPYLDAAGNDLTNVHGAPGTVFDNASIAPYAVKLMGNWQFLHAAGEPLTTSRGYVSPGGCSINRDAATGRYFLVFHTRFVGRGEQHEVRVHQMYLNADGWFVVAPQRYAGETISPTVPSQIPGVFKLINHGKDITATVKTSTVITLNADGSITGASTGAWLISGEHYATLNIDGTTYRGVFSRQWDDDNQVWVVTFSAISSDGVAVWGSKAAIPGPPAITTSPASQAVALGSSATFSVTVTSDSPLTYQWRKNGTAIAGATSATYTVTNVQAGNMGFYSVTVGNANGSVDSGVGILTVNAGSSRLTGLSTRGLVQAGGDLTYGFYLRGTGSKSTIVRAVGPTLSNYGVVGPLSDPKMDLIPAGGSTPQLSNDDWGTNSNLPALRAAMPFPLVEGSKDAAALATLSTATNAGYTVRVTPSGAATSGIALAEVYDLDAATAPVRFASLSTRGYSGTGENVLTVGFFITGDGPKQLLIRAVGPTLGAPPYNVPGVLADPQFRIVPLGLDLTVAANDNWGGTTVLQAAFAQTQAFSLPANSLDAAAIVRLPPGGYTVQATGVGGTTGNVLVEVYDMDP